MTTVEHVNQALDFLTGGRVVTSLSDITKGNHPFVQTKTSSLPGKSVIEIPGLIYGDPAQPVNRIAVTMTLTESSIELARATDVDAIIAHHPITEASNSGGVPLSNYMNLYGMSVFELHEAFHGLHPGIPFLHGHSPSRVEISYAGVEGNVMFYGQALEGVATAGDILDRLNSYMGLDVEAQILESEKTIRGTSDIAETSLETHARIVIGDRQSPVANIIHTFPHSGFTSDNLRQAVREHPETDTFLLSISRVYDNHSLIETARELGLNFIIGNCHCLEILENGLPLAYALEELLPDVAVTVFRERITSVPVQKVGNASIQAYGKKMASEYLVNKN